MAKTTKAESFNMFLMKKLLIILLTSIILFTALTSCEYDADAEYYLEMVQPADSINISARFAIANQGEETVNKKEKLLNMKTKRSIGQGCVSVPVYLVHLRQKIVTAAYIYNHFMKIYFFIINSISLQNNNYETEKN